MRVRDRLHGWAGAKHARPLAAAPAASRRARPTPRWLAMVFAALLSLSFHSFVVQTHVHFDRAATALLPAGDHADASLRIGHDPARPPAPLDCPVCRQLAHAASYVSPAPIAWLAPPLVASWFSSVAPRRSGGHRRSHAWQSRGPPR